MRTYRITPGTNNTIRYLFSAALSVLSLSLARSLALALSRNLRNIVVIIQPAVQNRSVFAFVQLRFFCFVLRSAVMDYVPRLR